MAVALNIGATVGGFDIEDVIGRGGFGITYRAREGRSGRIYAIKEYLPDGMSTRARTGAVTALSGQESTYSRGLQAFMSEANILKELPRREGLVRVRGAFEKSGTAYCVMEYIEGDSLDRMGRRVIDRNGYFPANLLADVAVAMCWALDGLHAKSLIHRDVKPANIMIRKSGEPVLIDFGAARRLSRRESKETIFTRKYAAIEQFPPEMSGFGRSFEEGPWSDLYSLAVVLYELIANRPPPEAPLRAEAVLRGERDPYEPLHQVAERLGIEGRYPSAIFDAIDRACALLPKERVRDADTFAELIAPGAWDKFESKDLSIVDPSDFHKQSAVPRTSRRTGVMIWLLILAGLTSGAVYWLYYSFFDTKVF